MKKLLALLMTCIMVFSVFSNALAETVHNYDEDNGSTYTTDERISSTDFDYEEITNSEYPIEDDNPVIPTEEMQPVNEEPVVPTEEPVVPVDYIDTIEINDFVVPEWGEEAFFDVTVPSDAHYSLDFTMWETDGGVSMNDDDVYNREDVAYYQWFLFIPEDGYEFASDVTILINGTEDYTDYNWCGVLYEDGTYWVSTVDFFVEEPVIPTNVWTYEVNNDGKATLIGYSGSDVDLIIPDNIDGYAVNAIGSNLFKDHVEIETIKLYDSVTSIGDYAFNGCSGLTDIDIPASVLTIGEGVFNGCSSIEEITLHEGTTTISAFAFQNCDSLKSIDFPASITSIAGRAFYSCDALEQISYPVGWSSTPYCWYDYNRRYESPFTGCTNLTCVTIPSGVVAVPEYAFSKCSSLSSLTIDYDFSIIVLQHNGHYYAAFDRQTLWGDAAGICEGFGGHLATISNADEQEFVKGIASKVGKTSWLGGSDYESEGNWVWITDEEWNYSNWASGEPNNHKENQHYLCMYTNGKWDDNYTDTYCPFICEWDSFDSINSNNVTVVDIDDPCINNMVSIGNYAFEGCSLLSDVFFDGTEEEWNTISIGSNNEPILYATIHFQHIHTFGEFFVVQEPTCTQHGKKCRTCCECGYVQYVSIDKVPHTYETTLVSPTYVEQGYTLYVCSVCGHSFESEYIDPLDRVDIAEATVTLEYAEAFYRGDALTPKVYLEYEGEAFDSETELRLTYANNDQVGTATVTVEGINRFIGSVVLSFEISYESIPTTILNVTAIGETNRISVSWGISSEVNTTTYKIYRKAETENEFTLVATVDGRDNLSYSDASVEHDVTYYYYVTGVGIYGEESKPSETVSARVGIDIEDPVITKLWPANGTRINGITMLTTEALDNVGVTKVRYEISLDSVEWVELGETLINQFVLNFDTTTYSDGSVLVRAIAFDAHNNASSPYVRTYLIDNTPPEKIMGLTASAVFSSKLTLVWDDVEALDRVSFVVQMLIDNEYQTLKTVSTIGYNVKGLKPLTEYSFRVACKDICGNQGEWSDTFTISTLADTTPPIITELGPAPCALNWDITFSATANDECGIASISIQASTDLDTWMNLSTQTYSELHTRQTYSVHISMSDYGEGYVYLRAVAIDGSGNTSTTDSTAAYNGYLIDRTAPDAPSGVAAEGQNGYITVSWTQGDENGLKYYIYRAAEENGSYSRIAADLTSINYHDRDVQTGVTYWYKVAVKDSCGNMSEKSVPVSAVTLSDTEKPVVNSFSQTYNNCISETYHTVSVLATDNSRLASLTVEYCINGAGEFVYLASVEDINDYSRLLAVSIPIEVLGHGDIVTLRAVAVDTAGLVSDFLTASYCVDADAPRITGFSALLEGNVCTLSWNGCGENDLSGYIVYRAEDGGDFVNLGSRAAKADNDFTFIDYIGAEESHTYTYRIVAADRLGNTRQYDLDVEFVYVRINSAPMLVMDIPVYMEINVEQYFDATSSTDDGSILSYYWDFGDGTSSESIRAVKKYSAAGTYTVTLVITDDEGLSATETCSVIVKERNELGILNIKVVDDTYSPLPNAKVLIDRGEETEYFVYTNGLGIATVQLPTGEHEVAAYLDSSHLPTRKTATVLANAERIVTLILVEEELVVGEFEITRMTLEEIIAAGIDVYDPANQNVYQVIVRVVYGGAPFTIRFQRNDTHILYSEVTDANGNHVSSVANSNGEGRTLTPVIIPCGGSSNIVAILDIPAQVSYLKEFFDVKLYITNHASHEFVLTNNEVTLNIPEGLTLMTGLSSYEDSECVSFSSLAGQETKMINWCLRGDDEGEYAISADYVGTLEYFDEIVTATFNSSEPIKVYGLNGIEMSILACDEIHNGAFYFKIGIENRRDIDIYMPNIGLFDLVKNVTESVAYDNEDGDFAVQSYLLNIYVESSSGSKHYLPICFDTNGNLLSQIDVLAPGQKLVYEYVAYNAVKDDTVGVFNSAMVSVLSGYAENVVVGSYNRSEFSLKDFSEKLDRILDRNDAEISAAYDYIMSDSNYYYVSVANDPAENIFNSIYKLLNMLLTFDIECLTMEQERDFAQQLILKMLLDEDTIDAIDDQVALKYLEVATNSIKLVRDAFIDSHTLSSGDFDDALGIGKSDLTSLTTTLATNGREAFLNELYNIYLTRLGGEFVDSNAERFYERLGLNDFVSYDSVIEVGDVLSSQVLNALNHLSSALESSYTYSTLYAYASNEYSNYVLDAIIEFCRHQAVDLNRFEHHLVHALIPATGNSLSQSERLAIAIAVVAQMDKLALKDDAASRVLLGSYLVAETGTGMILDSAVIPTIRSYVSKAFGAPYAIAGEIWSGINMYFNLGAYVKQQDSMVVYDFMSAALAAKISDYINSNNRSENYDLYTLTLLKCLCQMRLDGEHQYRESVLMYVDREYGYSITGEQAISLINRELGTSYSSIDEWYSELGFNILSSRDILFNEEISSAGNIPSAPFVSLDYELNQTRQSFSSEYEYCFADGEWLPCEGKPISFIPKGTQSLLRVRVAASDDHFAGEITTVYIYAQKELSRLITVKHDGTIYTIDNLKVGRAYQLLFADENEGTYSWMSAITFIADENGVGTVSSAWDAETVVIRSCVSYADRETYSIPLLRDVMSREKLDIRIIGRGTVIQSRTDGSYFRGESINLQAFPQDENSFLGWYVDGALCSSDEKYIFEMCSAGSIEARFSGSQPVALLTTSLPTKLVYSDDEELDLSGLVLAVQYEDGSTYIVENYTAVLVQFDSQNGAIIVSVGNLQVTIPVMITHTQDQMFTIIYTVNDSYYKEIKYCSGTTITAPDYELPEGYSFSGWKTPYNMPSENLIINATLDIMKFKITFIDWDGTTLKTQTVNYGGAATAPANPTRTGYTFTGWDKAFDNITANTVVTAQYTINTYTVTFKDWDGTVLKTQTVNYGSAATAPANPTRTGYTFTGWDKAFNNITADTVVTAQYTINSYTVTFKDWDGTTLKTQTVNYGGAATAPNNPTREGYTFTGWDKAFNNITANTVVTAQYVEIVATERYVPVTSIVTGKDYVLGYNDGRNVYLIMNYNADPLTSVYETSSYRYIYSSTYYAYGVKAVLDSSGNVIDVDRSIYSNASLENMKWNFITTSKGYKIRSAKEPSMYLRAHANSKYAHLFISSGYYNATDWNWNYSQRLMSYKLSGGVTKYISYVPTVNGYRNFFKAGKNVGTVVLYRRVEQISSYVVSNDISNAGLCMNVN